MKHSAKVVLLFVLAIALFASASPVLGSPSDQVRVYVEFASGRGPSVQAALNRAGAQFHYEFADLNSFVVTLPTAALNGILRNPNVVSIEEDPVRYLTDSDPVGTFLNAMIELDQPSQVEPYGVGMVQAPLVWADGFDGTNRTVCIIDTGYYADHLDLPDGVLGVSQIPGETYLEDGNGHGSHVAGTIAGLDNDIGVIGVAPGVDLFIVKIFDNTGEWVARSSDLVDAIYSCQDGGADVISMSLSGPQKTGKEQRAFDSLYAAGILSVAAASNDGLPDYHYPASYDSVVSVGALDDTMTIADFSNFNDQVELAAPGVHVLSTIPYFDDAKIVIGGETFEGYAIEYAALTDGITAPVVFGGLCLAGDPTWAGQIVVCERGEIAFYDKVMAVEGSGGVGAIIYNNVPDEDLYMTLGDGNSSVIPAISLNYDQGIALTALLPALEGTLTNAHFSGVSNYAYYGGTSMATPHVSAVAALIWSANTEWTNVQVREAMDATALDLGELGRDVYYGFGLVQAYDALQELLNGGGGGGEDIDLSASVRLAGPNVTVNLSWTGGVTPDVDIYRDSGIIATVPNEGSYSDRLGKADPGSAIYQVCEAGSTENCSNEVTVTWP